MGRQLARWLVPVVLLLTAGGGALPFGDPGAASRLGIGVVVAQEMPALPPGVSVGRRAITVLEADAATRTLAIFERIELLNETDTTFTPSMGGAQGPMGLLRFGLPRTAFDLTMDERLSAYDVIQVDRGFASLLPLPPGSTDVNFSYRVPYAGGDYELSLNAAMPTASLWVLVPGDFPTATTDLRLDRIAEVGRQRYQVLIADNLATGQRVSVSLAGLPFVPRPWWLDDTVQRAAAVALALLGLVLAWLYARRAAPSPIPSPQPAEPARLAETADL